MGQQKRTVFGYNCSRQRRFFIAEMLSSHWGHCPHLWKCGGVNWPSVVRMCLFAKNHHLHRSAVQLQQDFLSIYLGFACYMPRVPLLLGLYWLPDGLEGFLSWSCLVYEVWWRQNLQCFYEQLLNFFCCSTENATFLLKEGGGSADFPERCQVTNSPPKGLHTTEFFFKILVNHLGFFLMCYIC